MTNPNDNTHELNTDLDVRSTIEVEEIELPEGWTFRRPSYQGLTTKINHHCKEEILTTIRATLNNHGAEAFGRFENGCFGKFYDFCGKLGKPTSIIHEIMSYQIEQKMEKPYEVRELHFYIKGKIVKFRREEFALITGLHFGASEFDPHKEPFNIDRDSMYTTWYLNHKISHGKLADDFKNNRFDNIDEYVKAARILFVYNVILGLPKTKMICDWIWAIVEDEQAWESFPWGSLSYQHLIYSLNQIKSRLNAEGKIPSYHLHGCLTAFLAWIYSAFPEVGIESGLLNETTIPRMLRYEYSASLRNVMQLIITVKPTLEASEDEKETLFWQSVEKCDSPFLVSFPKYIILVGDDDN